MTFKLKTVEELIEENQIDRFDWIIRVEILQILIRHAALPHKDHFIFDLLASKITKTELEKTFDHSVVLIYDEAITVEIVTILNSWFSQQNCNIENIFFVTTHTAGLTNWWKDYSKLMGIRSFQIIELPLINYFIKDMFDKISDNPPLVDNNKNLDYYFDFYGGWGISTRTRDFLTALLLSEANFGYIEYKAGFLKDVNEFDNYLEEITGFCDRAICDKLLSASKKFTAANISLPTPLDEILNEVRDLSTDEKYKAVIDFKLNADISKRSFCQVLRETILDEPFSSITEKTLKCFLNLQIPIILTRNGFTELENLGFKFIPNLIDYTYQDEPNFYKRSLLMIKQLHRLKDNYTLNDLAEIRYVHRDIFKYNYDYIMSGDLFKNIYKNLRMK